MFRRKSKRVGRRTRSASGTPAARLVAALCVIAGAGCGESEHQHGKLDAGANENRYSLEMLMDPQTCASCHPRHFREWSSSMHAYAAKDPVFLAMNKRGQRETKGALGDFCVNCHAPMAVRQGLTKDGTNLDKVDEKFQGVTCYFCHNAVALGADHNGQVSLANDQTMRAPLHDAVDPGVHGVAYSRLHDRDAIESSQLCGSCHDVVTPKGVHIERTYAEYLQSGFSKTNLPTFQTCPGCHMDVSRSGAAVAEVPGMKLPKRSLHEHLWPGVDVALTEDFPDQAAQKKAVECALMNGTTALELSSKDGIHSFHVVVEAQMGHAQPSGAAQDRRLWLQFIAYDKDDNVIFQTGVIADGEPEVRAKDDPKYDPYLVLYRDQIFDAAGKEVHMFWDAESSKQYPKGYDEDVLPLAVDVLKPHVREIDIVLPNQLSALPARVTAQLMMRPVGIDILNDLAESGDLDPDVIQRMPTHALYGTTIEWTTADGRNPVTQVNDPPLDCPDVYLEELAKPL